MNNTPIYIVSACLIGLCTRYDGQLKKSSSCIDILKNKVWIPLCPEQLGGLPTPREAAVLAGGDGHQVLAGTARVLTKSGADVTAEFIQGAKQVLQIASHQKITTVYLKARSPSCGVSGTIGVTAALLEEHGIKVVEFDT